MLNLCVASPLGVETERALGGQVVGGGGNFFSNTGVQLCFRGIPRRGGEVRKKIRAKTFSGPQNLKFPYFYPTCLGMEGARRVFFKVTMHI